MNPIFFILWLLVMIFIGFPVAWICSWIYVLVLPLTACISGLQEITDLLLKGVQLPLYCAKEMIK